MKERLKAIGVDKVFTEDKEKDGDEAESENGEDMEIAEEVV